MQLVVSGGLVVAMIFAWGLHAGNNFVAGAALVAAVCAWLGNVAMEMEADEVAMVCAAFMVTAGLFGFLAVIF